MYKTIALTTALAVFAMLPVTPVAAADLAQLLMEEHYSEAGYEVDLYVTRGVDGDVLSEATLTDPATGESVEVWTDGITVWWDGMSDGEVVEGSMSARDVDADIDPEALFCLTPVTAIICIGVVLVASSASCAHFSNACPHKEPNYPGYPGDGGGVPDDGGGGDGDGDSGEGGKTGGGDED